MNKPRYVLGFVRNFLFSSINKEFLIFLFFLALSAIFWMITVLNETSETNIMVPVHIIGVPKNVVLTSDEVDTLQITVRDKGWVLLSYIYNEQMGIFASFKTYQQTASKGSISTNELQRLLLQRLLPSTRITSIKPDHFDFYFNYGQSKRVPVRWSGNVEPEHLYFISRVDYSPDSVNVFASEEKLRTIKEVYTQPLYYSGFRDSLVVNCGLHKITGVKIVPNRVRVKFFTDVLTEESVSGIPIHGINMPDGKVLRTFPAKATVSFVCGVSMYRNIRPSDFTVIVDYNEIAAHPSDKCKVYLKGIPHGISRAKLQDDMVDYLIEEE
jgi:hypothetical protein